MKPEARKQYVEAAAADKKRYPAEMEEYKKNNPSWNKKPAARKGSAAEAANFSPSLAREKDCPEQRRYVPHDARGVVAARQGDRDIPGRVCARRAAVRRAKWAQGYLAARCRLGRAQLQWVVAAPHIPRTRPPRPGRKTQTYERDRCPSKEEETGSCAQAASAAARNESVAQQAQQAQIPSFFAAAEPRGAP